MLEQFVLCPLRISGRLIALVDRHDDRYFGGLGMIDRFNGLRHDAVISCNDQHNNIRRLGTTRTHGGKSLVTWRVEECNFIPGCHVYLIGADMLGNPPCLAGNHICLAKRIQQRCLTVVNVTHDCDHRRTWSLQLINIIVGDQTFFDIRRGNPLHCVTHFFRDKLSAVAIDHIVDLHHFTLFHQDLDDINGTFRHTVGELLYGNRFRDHNFADNLCRRLCLSHCFFTLTLRTATHGSK